MTSLAGAAARGAAITLAGQVARLAIQLVTLVVLARLLDPADFGLVAMVMAVVGVGDIVRDVGLSNASIQARNLSSQQRSNLFWLSSSLGLVIAGVIAALSPVIAAFYGRSELVGITLAVSLIFLFNGLASQHKASLARALRFRSLAIIETTSPALGAAAAITAASLGAGYWALVLQYLVPAFMALALSLASARWAPGLPRRTTGMRPLVTYGLHLLGGQLVSYFSRNIDTVVIGQRFGAASAGYYSRAYELVMNPLNQINGPASKVATPILARLQDEPARYDAYLLRGQRTLMALTLPLLAIAVALAEPLVALLLGPGWEQSAVFLQLLAVAGMFLASAHAAHWVALSKGFTNVSLYVNLTSAPLYVAFILLGSLWGPVGVAVGYVAGTACSLAISFIWYSRAAGAPGWALFSNVVLTAAGTIPAALAAYAVAIAVRDLGPAVDVAIGVLVFAAVYALTHLIIPVYRREARDVLAVIALVRRRRTGE